MGAKQSKRSVDISGKEAEGAGEVAAAGAGGEGRVEQLADADALKPQLNGDAHIHEPSDKEKQLDSGTPENEKDATTEKEGKEQDEEKEKESTPVTNGDAEQKEENGESTPSPDDGKKPKKEKVKKKWSLRSISFSRKDKPKQEKKQKEEEPKANGEPEKVPEEIAETPDTDKNDIVQEDKAETESKEEKIPETPVTEPITNGSSTPETPKEESLTADEPIATVTEENDRSEIPKVEVTTEKISVNGLTVEESKTETPVAEESEISKPDESTIEKTEPVPATEIPVINEVCVEKMPLIEPTPPPLPANPPPSSVVSFAATTMAPELTDASLANNADIISNSTQNETSETHTEKETFETHTEKETSETHSEEKTSETHVEKETSETNTEKATSEINTEKTESVSSDVEVESQANVTNSVDEIEETSVAITDTLNDTLLSKPLSEVQSQKTEETIPSDITHDEHVECNVQTSLVSDTDVTNNATVEIEDSTQKVDDKVVSDNQNQAEVVCDIQVDNDKVNINEEIVEKCEEIIKDSETIPENIVTDSNVDNIIENDDTEKENLLNESKSLAKLETFEINDDDKVIMNGDSKSVVGDIAELVKPILTPEDSMPPSLSEAMESLPQGGGDVASNDASESFPLPPSELCRSESDMSPPDTPEPPADTLQEVLSTSDKMKELIPEVPTIPELKTEIETTTDVAVAN